MKDHDLKREAIIKDRMAGIPVPKIAVKHKVTPQYIYNYCPVNRRKKTGCPIAPEDFKLMQELLDGGMSRELIHEKFDEYPFYMLRDWLRRSEDIISLQKLRQIMEGDALPEGELTLIYKGKQLYRMVPI